MRPPSAWLIMRRPFFRPRSRCRFDRENPCKLLIGEVAERSKALDWNSSNISTGVRGFESHPLRQMVINSRAWCSRGAEGPAANNPTLSAKGSHGGPHRFLRDDQS